MGKWVWVFPLLLAGFCFWQGFSGEGQAVTPPVAEWQQSPLKTTPIRELQTGMRVIGDNPELSDQIIEPLQIDNPNQWRNVRLEMRKADDSQLLITLLRPVEWIDLNRAIVGSVIDLDLAELGAAGPATVMAIDPCPPIEPGHRPLITGTFEHTAANVIDLQIESEPEPIGSTDNHPFWSQDRQTFVEAGQLKVGEELRLADGRTTRVTSIIPRAGPQTVYNLEVSGEHVYHVGNTGVLVHNTYNPWTNFLKANKGSYRNVSEASLMYKFRNSAGSQYDDIVAKIPRSATSRTLTPVEGKVTQGIEYKWVSGGVTNRVRIHGPDPSAPAGSNAAIGWVFRVRRGNRVLDSSGNWQHINAHNINSPHYNPAVANATHIPILPPSP